jgi:multiple RNA-binding domain-containing protein 1
MRADTVAAAVAAHYGVSKAQLLDAAAADLPLRMALGEAQVGLELKACIFTVSSCSP